MDSKQLQDSLLRFPDNFFFGTSVSAFQVEGNESEERKTDFDAYLKKNPGQIIRPGENGVDWFGDRTNVTNDLKTIAGIGVSFQRISIEWSRIEPERGQFDRKALQYYRFLVDTCKANHLTPMITLSHFTLPHWVAEKGGWENHEIVEWFERFVSYLLEEFNEITYWIIVNEPALTVYLGNYLGIFPPNKTSALSAWKTRAHIIRSQKEVYTLLKSQLPTSQVGNAFSFLWLRPYHEHSIVEKALVKGLNYIVSTNFVSATKDHMDFIGMNYYTGYYIDYKFTAVTASMRNEALYVPYHLPFGRTVRPKSYRSDMGWPIVPDFFLDAMRHVYDTYKKPIIITENGIADRDDIYRSFYILTHLLSVWKAIEQGIDIRGYIHWATVDNLEWLEGYTKRFGLIKVNSVTGERTLQKGAKVYEAIIKHRGITVDKMIKEFIPEEQQEYAQYVTRQILGTTRHHCPRITKLS